MTILSMQQTALFGTLLIVGATWLSPVAGDDSTCLTSIQELYDSELHVSDDSILRKYILCPGTTYEIARDKNPPIMIGRSNVHVLCGTDGDSANNCVLKGGEVQIGIFDEFQTEAPAATNALVQGLTFEDAESLNILGNLRGSVTIRDCVFKNNANFASIYLQVRDETDHLNANVNDRPWVSKVDTSLDVVVDGCAFHNNVVGDIKGLSTGLIHNYGADITVRDTTFISNDNKALGDAPHFIIGNFVGELTLLNNCFIENDVTLVPVMNQADNLVVSESNYGDFRNLDGPSLVCEFITSVTQGSTEANPSDDVSFRCFNYESNICNLPSIPGVPIRPSGCIRDLTSIYLAEKDVTDSRILRTYTLCPNMTYDIGNNYDEQNIVTDGDQYLIIAHPNIHIRCGEDGNSANNCTLNGGRVQLGVFDEFDTGIAVTNAVVKGITFLDANGINVIAEAYGIVDFVDCVFEENSILAAVYVQLPVLPASTRKLADVIRDGVNSTSDARKLSTRRTQSMFLTITIHGCIFRNNVVGVQNDTASGLIENNLAGIFITDTLFINNTDAGKDNFGYLISNFWGDMQLTGNCFFNNEVTIAPVINKYGYLATSLSVSNSGKGNKQNSSSCDFLANIEGGNPDEPLSKRTPFTCLDFDSLECLIHEYVTNAPSAFPTVVPSAKPSTTPRTLTPSTNPTPQKLSREENPTVKSGLVESDPESIEEPKYPVKYSSTSGAVWVQRVADPVIIQTALAAFALLI